MIRRILFASIVLSLIIPIASHAQGRMHNTSTDPWWKHGVL